MANCSADTVALTVNPVKTHIQSRYPREDANRWFVRGPNWGSSMMPELRLLVHYLQELSVGISLHYFVQEKFHRVHRVHICEKLSQEPDPLEILLAY